MRADKARRSSRSWTSCFSETPCEDRVALNLGGIANVTVLRRAAAADAVRAWDCGPANMVLDGFVRRRTDGRTAFDRNGAWGLAGRVDASVVATLLTDPFFARSPPRSTGRERFGPAFLARHAASLDALSLVDGCATLTAFVVEAIARDLERFAPPDARLIVSGGGVRNRAVVEALTRRLPRMTVARSDAFGVDADLKEAIAFALLAMRTLRGEPGNLPTATGATAAVLLGTITPHGLAALLAKMERESTAKGRG